MDIANFLLLYLFHIITSVESFQVAVLATQAAGSGVFENAINGKRLKGFRIYSRSIPTRSGCVAICNRNPKCLSINFCGRATCELSNEDIFSTSDGENVLADDELCTYVSMHRSEIPNCQERGFPVDIKDDSRVGICNIKGKRVDLEWGGWGAVTVATDNSVELIKVQRRTPKVEVAHGGIASGVNEKVAEWLLWVRESMTWEEARDNCVKRGGQLFSDVDGTKDQLDFLYDKVGQESHWLGILTTDHQTWYSIDGSKVGDSRLLWDPDNAFNHKGSQYHVSNFERYLNDVNKGLELASVCDMLP